MSIFGSDPRAQHGSSPAETVNWRYGRCPKRIKRSDKRSNGAAIPSGRRSRFEQTR
jgi:hypothetical protein